MGMTGKKYRDCSDSELMQGVLEKDPGAFSELYDRYAAEMAGFFSRRLGDDTEKARDFLHDLFYKVLHQPERFTPGRPVRPWLYTLAMNMCRNEYRSLRVQEEYRMKAVHGCDGVAPEPPGTIDRERFSAALAGRLEQLPPSHREVFRLRFGDELSLAEIAGVLGIPEGTVKSRLFYALKTLASKLRVFEPLNSS